jgi:hypothetical protein
LRLLQARDYPSRASFLSRARPRGNVVALLDRDYENISATRLHEQEAYAAEQNHFEELIRMAAYVSLS